MYILHVPPEGTAAFLLSCLEVLDKRRAWARRGRAGPVRAAILAEEEAHKNDERKDDVLNGGRRIDRPLRLAVPPKNTRQVEYRRFAGRAGINHREDSLEVAIEIDHGRDVAGEFEEIGTGIPPPVWNARRQYCRTAGRDSELFGADFGAESSGENPAFFALMKMHMQRWAVRTRRQRSVESQDHLAVLSANARHDERFAGMAVTESQVCQGQYRNALSEIGLALLYADCR